jgi:hypothetical protein
MIELLPIAMDPWSQLANGVIELLHNTQINDEDPATIYITIM